MEDKNILNDNELEKVSGGRKSDYEYTELCLYCADCSTMLIDGLDAGRPDIIEEKTHYYEQHHSCCPGKTPRILVGIYNAGN